MWVLSSPTRDWTHTHCVGNQSLNHWTTRKVPWEYLKRYFTLPSLSPSLFLVSVRRINLLFATLARLGLEVLDAKSLQSCPTLCNPIDGSPPGSPVPGILQARTLEWVAISFSSAWKWKVKVKSLSCVRPSVTPWTAAFQAPPSMGFSSKSTGVGCHCLLRLVPWPGIKCGP